MKIIIFNILFAISIFGQSFEDSLLTLISNTDSYETKIEHYNSLAWELRSNKAQKALQYADDAISLIQKINKPELLAKTYNFKGVIYRNKGDFANAIKWYNLALENALKYQDSTQIAYSYNNLGGIFKLQGNSPLALEYMLKALKYFEATGNKSGIGFCTINIATLYRREGDFENALKYLDRCLEVRKELNYKHGISLALYQKALILKEQRKFEESLKEYKKVLALFKELNDFKGIAVTYEGIGEILFEMKDYQNSEKNLQLAMKLAGEVGDKQTSARTSFKLAVLYAIQGDKKKALTSVKEGKKFVRELNIPAAKLEELKYESKFYELLKDYKKSLSLYKEFSELKDSLYSVANKEKVASIQAAYNAEKEQLQREQENAYLRKELEIKKTQRMYGIIVFILILITVFLILWKYSSTKKLASQLKEAVVTKDRFMKILAHDLRNPINTTMGFLQLLKTDGENMSREEREEIVNYANNSISKNSLLLENLLEWNKLQDKNYLPQIEKHNLEDIFLETVKIMEPLANAKIIKITYNFCSDVECFCDKNMARTILRNLLNNAIKFTNTNGKIDVFCNEEENFVKISVKDSGIGIEEEWRTNIFNSSHKHSTKGTHNETGTGLGLLLCKEYVEINKGEIGFTSEINVGSTFWFTLPKANEKGNYSDQSTA